jgi:hypothetical protein
MERPMQTFRIGCEALIAKFRRLRSVSSAQICRRLASSLCVVLIAFLVLAATTADRRTPTGNAQSAGGNLMLKPGWAGLAPALY